MAVINVSAGSQAVLQLAPSADDLANVAANVMTVPQMQDITINNSTGVFRFKTLDNTAESAVTTPATNQLSLNVVVDETTFFGEDNDPATKGAVVETGLFGVSSSKTKVYFRAYFSDPSTSGSKYLEGSGFISGLSPTVNMDAPVWISPVTIEVDGDFVEGTEA
jgi:hypothetical protein